MKYEVTYIRILRYSPASMPLSISIRAWDRAWAASLAIARATFIRANTIIPVPKIIVLVQKAPQHWIKPPKKMPTGGKGLHIGEDYACDREPMSSQNEMQSFFSNGKLKKCIISLAEIWFSRGDFLGQNGPFLGPKTGFQEEISWGQNGPFWFIFQRFW